MTTTSSLRTRMLILLMTGIFSLTLSTSHASTLMKDRKLNRTMKKFSDPIKSNGVVILLYEENLKNLTMNEEMGYKIGVGLALGYYSAGPEELVAVIFASKDDQVKFVVAKQENIGKLMNKEITDTEFYDTLSFIDTSKDELQEKYDINLAYLH